MEITANATNQALYMTCAEQTPSTAALYWLQFTNVATGEQKVCRGTPVIHNSRYTKFLIATNTNDPTIGIYAVEPGTFLCKAFWTSSFATALNTANLAETGIVKIVDSTPAIKPTYQSASSSNVIVYQE
jgi:hypothetical protein